jgi:Fic family protein
MLLFDEFISKHAGKEVTIEDFEKSTDIPRRSLFRYIKQAVEDGYLIPIKRGYYRVYQNPIEYIRVPFFSREKRLYNPQFLGSYIPNTTSFFTKTQKEILHNSLKDLNLDTDFFLNNKRLLEITLIDLSFASSSLEGNTYDYVDTEILVKYNEIAKDKTQDDTQMILNHKKCIEYMLYYKKELPYTKRTFMEIHTLLGEKLLPRENLGIIRNRIVEIGASAYTPLDNQYQLEEEFEIFLSKLQKIENPFEQSLFILVFIPYFQIFLDINKRTSRMSANLPLLKHNMPLISLLAVERRDYIDAILAIYELHDPSLMAELYTNNYLLNMHRYI